jgi:tripartite motif-containing protein 71
MRRGRRVVRLGLVLATAGLLSLVSAPSASAFGFVTQWGTMGSGDGQFNGANAVATDASGAVYVSDGSNNRVEKFSASGAFITKWGTPGSGNGQFNTPDGIATDSVGNVYVADYGNNRIEKFDSSGNFLTSQCG